MFISGLFASLVLYLHTANAAFGVTSSDGKYVVDAGSSNSFVMKVSRWCLLYRVI